MPIEMTRLATESPEYVAAREDLRRGEIELMELQERIAAQRRRLPTGPAVENYVFEEGPADLEEGDEPVRQVELVDLFSSPDRSLIVYHLMYGKAQTSPCPMCTMWIDGFNGVVDHVTQNADFVIVAAADVPALRAHARRRRWNRLRLLSAGSNTFKYDLNSEDEDGNQDSTISVFTRDPEGIVRHFYTAHPWMSPDVRERGIDRLTPTWNLLDLIPQGRGEWYSSLDYSGSASS
jgi:predicted dithiol-disulfide oxidoreductase (DUF899 family)